MSEPLIPYSDRPTDMLQRQLLANRKSAQHRNPETGRWHFAHDDVYRRHFVVEIVAMKRELRARGATIPYCVERRAYYEAQRKKEQAKALTGADSGKAG